MPVADVAAIHIGLARFAGAVYPDNLEHIDAVLAACTSVRSLASTLHYLQGSYGPSDMLVPNTSSCSASTASCDWAHRQPLLSRSA